MDQEAYKKLLHPGIFEYLTLEYEGNGSYKFLITNESSPIGYLIYEKVESEFGHKLDVIFEPMDKNLPKVTLWGRLEFTDSRKAFWQELRNFVMEEWEERKDKSYDWAEEFLEDVELPNEDRDEFIPDEEDLPF